MNKFIHLRGGSGSGKTSTVKSFLSRGDYKLKYIIIDSKKYPYMVDEKQEIICTGRYKENDCGGLDGVIESTSIMQKYLWKIMKDLKPKIIVFEAVMYGKTFKFGYELHCICRKLGYKYIGVLLQPTLEQVFENISNRNYGKPINEDYIQSGYFTNFSATKKLRENGVFCAIENSRDYKKDELYKVIEKYV